MAEFTTTVGYLGVLGSVIFFGSFGVLTKTRPMRKAKVDPLVIQVYMSIAIFLSSWILAAFVPFVFTEFGIYSAALWVPANCLAIAAIQLAGLGVSQGVWSGVTILTSFLWGAFVYHDAPIESILVKIVDLAVLLVGIVGLALTSGGLLKRFEKSGDAAHTTRESDWVTSDHSFEIDVDDDAPLGADHESGNNYASLNQSESGEVLVDGAGSTPETEGSTPTKRDGRTALLPGVVSRGSPILTLVLTFGHTEDSSRRLRRFLLGMACAVTLGLMNGSMLVPMKYVPPEAKGIDFAMSFGIGVLAVTPCIVVPYFLFYKRHWPQFHVRVASWRAMVVGLFWNIGNVSSMIATMSPLGLTIGFPLTQCALLVGGLWGVLYFREIKGTLTITAFILSACTLLAGAAMLSLVG